MKRFMVVLTYDGHGYYGFQRQKGNLKSIQGEVEKALTLINKSKVEIVGAGRTDKGVHALGQVLHFDIDSNMNATQYKKALNSLLKKDIRILKVKEVNQNFHARFSKGIKTYFYLINLGEYDLFKRNYIYQYNAMLDIDKMKEAAKLFVGVHDFRNFCAAEKEDIVDYKREIFSIDFILKKDILKIEIKGNGFLRYMVRMIVGVLIEIGKKRKNIDYVKERLDKNKLIRSNYKAPSEGLYLKEIKYE